jgi:hypothetical protein
VKTTIARIIELSYFQVVVIFLVLVLLDVVDVLTLSDSFRYIILVLPLLSLPLIFKSEPEKEKKSFSVPFLLLVLFAAALSLRFLPLSNSNIPLGYDPGFYKYTLDTYVNALPQIPEAALADWMREIYPQGLPILSDTLYVVAGTDSMDLISYLFPILGALLVFPVYMVTSSVFGKRAGLIAAVLYVVSYVQYTAFTLLYFKNMLGLLFLLLAIYTLEKEKYGLMVLPLAALGIFHRPEFLLFALLIIPYFLLHRKREIVFAVAGAAILVLPFWLVRWEANWGVMTGTFGTIVSKVQTGEVSGGGTFFDLATYIKYSVAYLPFTLIGFLYLVKQKVWNSLLILFIIITVIVVARLFFFNRFIIPLDIVAITLAVAGINYTLLNRKDIWRLVGICATIVLLIVTAIPTIKLAADTRPLIREEQLEVIEWIENNTEEEAYVLATTNDAPWVLGWCGRRVIAPGLFEWDKYEIDQWRDFISTDDPRTAAQFLDIYENPVYIYYSREPNNYLVLDKFSGEFFETVYNSDEAVLYKYSGGGLP